MPRSQHPGREGVGHARQPAHLPRAYLSRAPPLTSRPRPPPAGSSIRRRRRSRPSAATQTHFSRRPFRAPLEQPGLQLRGRRVPHTRILLYFFSPVSAVSHQPIRNAAGAPRAVSPPQIPHGGRGSRSAGARATPSSP